MVLAYEFYPFTRTNEWDYQKKYIQMCLKNLRAGGLLLIGLPHSRETKNLMDNEKNLGKYFKEYYPHKLLMPYSRMITLCAGHIKIAKAVSSVMALFKVRHYFLVFENTYGHEHLRL